MGKKASTQSADQASVPVDEVVVMLELGAQGGAPTPSQSRKQAADVLAAAATRSGCSPLASTVFDALHSVSVRAPRPFIEALRNTQGVAQVVANQLPASALIEPVKKRRLKLP